VTQQPQLSTVNTVPTKYGHASENIFGAAREREIAEVENDSNSDTNFVSK
jgi:hypothetical protein